MFCVNCGKEVEEGWVKCPYCGTLLKKEAAPINDIVSVGMEKTDVNERGNEEPHEDKEVQQCASLPPKHADGRRIKHRCFWKYLLLSLVTFGIYGICVLYGFVKDVNDICEDDGKKSPNYIIVLLLGMATCGIYTIYWWYKQGNRIQTAATRYGVSIRENGTTILIWYILGCTLMPGVGIFVGTYIMFDNVNRIALSYNHEVSMEEVQHMEMPHPHLIRNVAVVYAAMIVVVIVLMLGLVLLGSSGSGGRQSEEVETQVEEDLSDVDMETFIGKPGEELEKLGFAYDVDFAEYRALDGKIYVSCDDDGKVDIVMIEDAEGKEPTLHGVKIGMTEAEVSVKLKNAYPVVDKSDNKIAYVNTSTGGCVLCEMENGAVIGMTYMVLSADELADELAEDGSAELGTYIFPNSDKKYLSEDEVRSVEADKLMIGRNEIFARHGRLFDDAVLAEYFSSQPWYQGTIPGAEFNSDAAFNDFEKKNVEMIKRIEDEVNGVQEDFMGMTGVYISTSPPIDGLTGKIEIMNVSEKTVSFNIGLLEDTSSLISGEAQITSGDTAQANIDGFIVTFTWSDGENMYVANSGNVDSREAGGIHAATDAQSYTRPLEFNQW